MKVYFSTILLFFTFGILLMVGYIFYLLFGPYEVPKVGKITPVDPIEAGKLSKYEAENCVTTNQEAEISRVLVSIDKSPEVVIGVGSNLLRQFHCSNVILIPQETPTGDYRLVITANYKVNPLRTVLQTYESEKFHVDNPNPDYILPPQVSQQVDLTTPSVQTPSLIPVTKASPQKNVVVAPTPAPPQIQPDNTPSPQPVPSQPVPQPVSIIPGKQGCTITLLGLCI